MSELNRVVAHLTDGTLVKGTTHDFAPGRPKFHVTPLGGVADEVEVQNQYLKAVFFVHSLDGDPGRHAVPGFGHVPNEINQGKRIAVEFKDGEVLHGYTLAYTPERDGFFMVPADPGSNNIRVYVVKRATKKIMVGSHADTLQKGPDTSAA